MADNLAQRIQTKQDALVRKQIIRTLATSPTKPPRPSCTPRSGIPIRKFAKKFAATGASGQRGRRRPQGSPRSAGSIEDTAVRLLAEALSGDTNMDVRLAAAQGWETFSTIRGPSGRWL